MMPNDVPRAPVSDDRGDHQVTKDWNPFCDEAMTGLPLPEEKRRYIALGWSGLRPQEEWE
jgi:hypothetical protein